jgi:hypothetical protein
MTFMTNCWRCGKGIMSSSKRITQTRKSCNKTKFFCKDCVASIIDLWR